MHRPLSILITFTCFFPKKTFPKMISIALYAAFAVLQLGLMSSDDSRLQSSQVDAQIEIAGDTTQEDHARYNLSQTSVSLAPESDAYVRAGTFANNNFGSEDRLTVKLASPNYSREFFLKFDLSSVSGLVTDAKLVLHPRSVGKAVGFINEAAIVTDDSWSEASLTWNNKPAPVMIIGSWTPVANETVEMNVTSQVQANKVWDENLSVRIYSPADVGSGGWVHYHSKEGGASNAPELVITTIPKNETTDSQIVVTSGSDAYVRGGGFANDNFGPEARLTVKAGLESYTRESYLRFDLESARGMVSVAKLVLYPMSVGSAAGLINEAALVSNDDWDENSLTWNNRPNSGEILSAWIPISGQPIELDVTSQVQAALTANEKVSFRINSPNNVGDQGWAHYSSKETGGANLPKLVVTTSVPKEPGGIDAFGITMLYPGEPGTSSWDSSHWNNGVAREITSSGDQYDPENWSMARGVGSLSVQGNGILTMSGSEPRIYLDGTPDKFWKNVEITVYYKRITDDAVPWAGLVVGARGGPDGHTDMSPCTATTYHARFRHDGKMDFEKELKHPWNEIRESQLAWAGDPLPHNQWIGMKFVLLNVDNGQHVRLELYRDMTEGVNGGVWEKMAEYVDSGGWAPAHDCDYAFDHIITEGGGTVFVRNSGVNEALYKWFSVREIVSP